MLWSPRVDCTTSLFYSPSFEFMREENGHTRKWRWTLSLLACHNLTAFVSHVMRGQKWKRPIIPQHIFSIEHSVDLADYQTRSLNYSFCLYVTDNVC